MKRTILLLVFVAHFLFAFSQQSGRPVLRCFDQKSYGAHPQNYCAIQDKRGIVYVGNNDGLLEFDGLNWKLIKTSNKSGVRCLCTDSSGIIFAGANNDFGFLAYDSQGNTLFQSLIKVFGIQKNDFGIVWKVVALKNAVYFLCSEAIFEFNYRTLSKIDISLMPQYGFEYNNKLYVFTENGLASVDRGEITNIEGTSWLYDNNIIVPLMLANKNIIMVGDVSHISLFKNGNWQAPTDIEIDKPVSDFVENAVPYCLVESKNNSIIIGSLAEGLLELDLSSSNFKQIDKLNGLSDNTVIGLYSDSYNNVWALLNNGIDIILINKPLLHFGEEDGLQGAVMAVGTQGNIQYAATYTGLMERAINESSFTQVAGINEVCWSILSYRNSLLVSHEFEILKIVDNNISSINTGKTTYCFGVHTLFPNVVFLGQDGLSALVFNDDNSTNIISFPEIAESPVRKIEEGSDGTLWITSEFDGIYGLRFGETFNSYSIEHIDTTLGLNTMLNNYVHCIGNRTFVASPEGISEIIQNKTKHFVVSPSDFEKIFTSEQTGVSQMIPENDSTIWANTNIGIGRFVKRNNNYVFINTIPLGLIPDAFKIFLNDSMLWITTGQGLYSFNINKIPENLPFSTNISKVLLNGDSILFAGSFTSPGNEFSPTSFESQTSIPEIEYHFNDITFDFVGFAYENPEENQYSYILDGYESNWHSWSSETRKEYTNLPEGNYTFKVRCRNNYGIVSSTTEFSFVILPPWYRTWLAYFAYLFSLILLLFVVVRLNSMRLRRANIRLENTVVERTAVIANQKKEITDSIEYAARIQKSMLPRQEHTKNFLKDYFVLNLPRDIVSGDFYWLSEQSERVYFCVADCTGHGVPGAFMSMLGISALNQLISQQSNISTDSILNRLRTIVIDSLHQEGKSGENADGMDIAICSFQSDKRILQYSGANISLIIVRRGELIEIKGNKMPVGTHILQGTEFSQHEINIEQGDIIYLFSDGFTDQFGGPLGKKYSSKRLKETLTRLSTFAMEEQKEQLKVELTNWLEPLDTEVAYSRMDDIIVLGIRV